MLILDVWESMLPFYEMGGMVRGTGRWTGRGMGRWMVRGIGRRTSRGICGEQVGGQAVGWVEGCVRGLGHM